MRIRTLMTSALFALMACASSHAQAPAANFTANCPALQCTFDATSTVGKATGFTWDWGNGRVEPSITITRRNTFAAPGVYAITLTATNASGSSKVTKYIVVPSRLDGSVPCLCAAAPPPVVVVPPPVVVVPPPVVVVPPVVVTPPPVVVQPPIILNPPIAPPTGSLAEMPRVYINTAAPVAPAVGGVIRSATNSANLQVALNAAQPGDVVELANGVTFVGNFLLPNKNTTSTAWITIRPASMMGVPPEGKRMSPAAAALANLPIVQSASNLGAFTTADGAHHYRLVALEVTVPATINNTGLIRIGTSYETTLAQLPHHFVLDRMYIHGTPTGYVRRGVAMNGGEGALIDSYVSEIHDNGADSQTIAGWGGTGPFKITNNYLEAASENVIFGGADPSIPNLVSADIEIRFNHFTKKIQWFGKGFNIKNLFELKSAKRVLVEGNVMENNWADGQGGSAVNMKSVNQGGSCGACGTQDVTFRLNLIKNSGAGFVLSGADPFINIAPVTMQRITIVDNILTNIDVAPYLGDSRAFLINGGPIDLVIQHNTVIDPKNTAISFGGPATTPPVRLIFRDNIVGGGDYGVKGPGVNTLDTFKAFLPAVGAFVGNVVTRQPASAYPAGNFFPATLADVGFTSDFRLSAVSPYRGKGSDGRDPGADVAAVLAATAGVVQP